jgi:lipopolysaccharide transport system ATP-binding protein
MKIIPEEYVKTDASDAIVVRDVSKFYRMPLEKKNTVYDNLIGLLKGNAHSYREFWALKDINFSVKKGETFGVIGPNGSGKSTLLKIIAGVLYPDEGIVKVNGKIAPFLELGVGFQQDLSAEDNVYLYGSVMGLTRRQIQKQIDEIFHFGELEKFRNIKLKNFSSGMYARLAFSTAISTDPDIILIDEALSVGDEAFQGKCYDKINEFRRDGKTIVFVSHGMDTIKQLCNKSILINHGVAYSIGNSDKVVDDYRSSINKKEEKDLKEQNEKKNTVNGPEITPRNNTPVSQIIKTSDTIPQENLVTKSIGSGVVKIADVKFFNKNGNEGYIFKTGESMTVKITYFAREKVKKPVFGIAIHRNDGIHITGPNTKFANNVIDFVQGAGIVDYTIDRLPLLKGTYMLTAVIYDYDCVNPYDHPETKYKFKVIDGEVSDYGLFHFDGRWKYG